MWALSVMMALSAMLMWGMARVRAEAWHLLPAAPAVASAVVSRHEAAGLLGVSPTAPAHVVEAALQAHLEALAREGGDEERLRALVASRDLLVPWRS